MMYSVPVEAPQLFAHIYIVSLALATSELATTDFVWEKKYHSRILPIPFFFKVAFSSLQ